MALHDKVTDFYGLASRRGDIGLEIEVEGSRLPHIIGPGWTTHDDHSLRGESFEYVFRSPVQAKVVPDLLNQLDKAFKENKSDIRMSNRTSVHVHLNVQQLMVQEVYNIIAMGFIMDNLLVEYSGPNRIGNLFCLRQQDAEYAALQVALGAKNKSFLNFTNDNVRYAAMNLLAVKNYGSIEFRSMRGTVLVPEIQRWIDILLKLKASSLAYNDPRQIVEDLYDNGPRTFLFKNFDEDFAEQCMTFKNWRTSMERGSYYAFELAYNVEEWGNLVDMRVQSTKRRKLKPGQCDDIENDPRFEGKSAAWIDHFLKIEKSEGEFIRHGTESYVYWARIVTQHENDINALEGRAAQLARTQVQPVNPEADVYDYIQILGQALTPVGTLGQRLLFVDADHAINSHYVYTHDGRIWVNNGSILADAVLRARKRDGGIWQWPQWLTDFSAERRQQQLRVAVEGLRPRPAAGWARMPIPEPLHVLDDQPEEEHEWVDRILDEHENEDEE